LQPLKPAYTVADIKLTWWLPLFYCTHI